jgi:hypothetical protein
LADRIVSLSLGTVERIYFPAKELEQIPDEEYSAAPYLVYKVNESAEVQALGVRDIQNENIHMVHKTDNSW